MSESGEDYYESEIEDYDEYYEDDLGAERAVLERVAQEVDDPKTFEGALRIANRNLENYNASVSENTAKNIILVAETKIPNYETKNPYACILSYMCIKNGVIHPSSFTDISKVITKYKDLNIKVEDLVRYCRMWLTYN